MTTLPCAFVARMSLSLALTLAAGCLEEIDPGELQALELQPTTRFLLGATFYLPRPTASCRRAVPT